MKIQPPEWEKIVENHVPDEKRISKINKEFNSGTTTKVGKGPVHIFLQRTHVNGQKLYVKLLNITNHQRNANQTTRPIISYLSKLRSSKRQKIIITGEDVETLPTVYRNEKWYSI